MKSFATEQEAFWAGAFGNEYIERNNDAKIIASNLSLFSSVLKRTEKIKSVIEFGSNIGLNLIAIKSLLPAVELAAVEINEKATTILSKSSNIKIYQESIIDFKVDFARDFVLFKGVLIHLNPEYLPKVYKMIQEASKKYICIAEYYNPSPVEVIYRGEKNRLFKRDFAGELLDMYPDLKLIDYGFCYHRDKNFPMDDITWFLLEKNSKEK